MHSAMKQYYNINKIFLSKIGGWPTQSTFTKILLPTIMISLMFSIGFLEFVRLSETWRVIMKDCECLIIILISIGGYVKLLAGVILNTKNVERLLSLIDYHWRIFTHSLEREVMHDYAAMGRKMTITYAIVIYSLMSLYMLIPLMPKLLDLIKPLNESRQNLYLFDVDYNFDKEEYFYPVLIHSYLITVMTMNLMVTIDTIYLVFAQHACGLFAAIGQRLENLGMNSKENNWPVEDVEITCEKQESTNYILSHEDKIYRELILILQKHQLIIEYVYIFDSSFAIYSFALLLINIIVTSLLGIQILSLLDHKDQMLRYVAMAVGSFLHLFILSYPGQIIIDHSTDVFNKAYNVQWYKMSRRSTQLLSILLYRCYVPCTLTAGKIYVLSMANYAAMVQTSASYFTAFSSFS